MTTLILAALLLFAGEVGAGDLQFTTCSAGLGGVDHIRRIVGIETVEIHGPPRKCTTETIHLEPDPCLAQMKAAMRHLDDWVHRSVMYMPPPEFIAEWDAAKACWRDP